MSETVARARPSPTHAPAIIAGPVISFAAIFVPRTSAFAAFRGYVRDLSERGVRSDFRGEGAMAGALGVALGGPRLFNDETLAGAWVGDGRRQIQNIIEPRGYKTEGRVA